MIQSVTFATYDTLPTDLAAVVDMGLGDSNASSVSLPDVMPLACSAKLANGDFVGGAVGRTWGECCELQQIWIDPRFRRQGIATRLLAEFETTAIRRGCVQFFLETFSFQCPELYLKAGYITSLTIRGFPDAVEKYIMAKRP